MAVDAGRLCLGEFAQIAPLFRQIPRISDARPPNLAHAPRMRSETETGDRREFSIFPEYPMRSAIDPGRLILGPFAQMKPRFRRLLYISDAPPN